MSGLARARTLVQPVQGCSGCHLASSIQDSSRQKNLSHPQRASPLLEDTPQAQSSAECGWESVLWQGDNILLLWLWARVGGEKHPKRQQWKMSHLRQRSSVGKNTEMTRNEIHTATNYLCGCPAYGSEKPFGMGKFSLCVPLPLPVATFFVDRLLGHEGQLCGLCLNWT